MSYKDYENTIIKVIFRSEQLEAQKVSNGHVILLLVHSKYLLLADALS